MDMETGNLAKVGARSIVRLGVTPMITLKEAQAALAEIAKMHGCTACGFSGIHILFEQVVDIAHELKLPSIHTARVEPTINPRAGVVVVDG